MFYIKPEKIQSDKDIPAFIKEASTRLVKESYLTAGEFFSSLKDDDLKLLNQMLDKIKTLDYSTFVIETEEEELNLLHVSILCAILSTGEGQPDLTPEMMQAIMPNLISLSTAETLYRLGRCKAIHKNFSLFNNNLEVIKIKKNL